MLRQLSLVILLVSVFSIVNAQLRDQDGQWVDSNYLLEKTVNFVSDCDGKQICEEDILTDLEMVWANYLDLRKEKGCYQPPINPLEVGIYAGDLLIALWEMKEAGLSAITKLNAFFGITFMSTSISDDICIEPLKTIHCNFEKFTALVHYYAFETPLPVVFPLLNSTVEEYVAQPCTN